VSTEGIAGEELVELAGSHRNRADISGALIDAPADDVVTVTIVLRRKNELPEEGVHGRERLSRAEFASRHGADPADIERVQAFAQRSNLRVAQTNVASRRVQVEGTVAALQQAFGVRLQTVAGGTLRVREGSIMIPASLQGVVLGVFGLDNRPQAEPRIVVPADMPAGITSADYTATDLAALYDFPGGVNGIGQTIGILELGGGYTQTDVDGYFSGIGLATPPVTAVSVDGATNSPGNYPPQDDPDLEVALDIDVAGGCAPGANIVVYFAPNTDQGFVDAAAAAVHDQANHPSVISISWGSAEVNWTAQAMQAMDQTFAEAAALGISVFVAAADHGSADNESDGLAHVDFPASSPNATGCGGTHLDSSGNTITDEVVWNDNNGWATGGGVSDQFALPAWQQNAGVPPSVNPGNHVGRGVPDVAGAADFSPGFRIYLRGSFTTVGGTSGVAPMWAGLTALLNQAIGRNLGGLNPLIYPQPGLAGFHDITVGNNGAYSAGPGWDACTGLGSPDGSALLAALRGPYPLTWQEMQNTAGFGNLNDGQHLFWIGGFSGNGEYFQVLFYDANDSSWWLGEFAGGGWQQVDNTTGFGNLNDGQHLFWIGGFGGADHDQILFYDNNDSSWWLGDFAGGGWQEMQNTAGFGNLNDGQHLFWIGNFTGVGHDQVLMYDNNNNDWLIADFAGGGWQQVANTAGFGNLNDGQHLFWIGNFNGAFHAQVLFYDANDSSWWLGDFAGGGWQQVDNTAGFGNLNDGQHLFWTGDFSGFGHSQVLFYDANDSSWWLRDFTGGAWQPMENTAGFGNLNDRQHLFWIGDFAGKGHAQVLFYDAKDGNWWLGDFAGGGWQQIDNTGVRGFGNLNDGQHLFWIGDFGRVGHAQVLFYDANDSNWWLGTGS
jgi:kumamolisin